MLNPARWQRVKDVFQSALEQEPARRLAFVAEACAGEQALEQAVQALLAAHDDARGFLESPDAVDRAAAALFGHDEGPPVLSSGSRLGPYEVLELLEAGGMGEVYRARDTRLQREVALKVLRSRSSGDPDRLRRLEAEARAAAAISDQNVVTVFDVGSADGVPYVISELLEGETLGQKLRGSGLERHEAIEYGIQIARGLAAAHAQGVVHRDLKPDNVFLTRQGGLKLLDFGIAKLMQEETEVAPGAAVSPPGSQSTTLGTPGYVAPEQLEGRPVDARADIFALGAVLYRLLAGRSPFADQDTTADVSLSLIQAARPLTSADRVPIALARIVTRCLERQPEDRFQSATEVRLALQAFAASSVARRRRRLALGGVLAAAALLSILLLDPGGNVGRLRTLTPAPIGSLAIMPLEDTSGDAGQQYLAEGLTDDLIARVGRTPGLRVIARTSVLRFKERKLGLPEIARQLGVDAVLEGTVRRSGEGVRIAVRLARGATGERLWAGAYERPLHEVPALLQDMATGIVGASAHAVRAAGDSVPPPPRAVEAYEAYLRGRHYWNLRSSDALPKAIEEFNRALELDPLYAAAYTGLADSFATLGDTLYLVPHKDAFARAEAAATRALELDPSEAEAHATLGHLHMHAWRWADAEREFQRALQLNPGYATAHQWRAYNLASLGRLDEAVAASQKAEQLDPLSPVINVDLAQILFFAGRTSDAIAQCRKTLQMNPSVAGAHRVLFLVLLRTHHEEEASRELATYLRVHPEGRLSSSVGYGYALLGHRAEALKTLAELERRPGGRFVPPYNLAVIHAGLGERDRAFARLDEALLTNDPESMILPADPRLDGLRADPRFAGLLRRMSVPQPR